MSKSDVLPEQERPAWKFLPYGLRRGEPITDGSVPIVESGKPVRLDDWREMREPYLYASDSALGALRDSTGLIVVRVRLRGTILRRRKSGKLYATEYDVLWWGDSTWLLNEYACALAERLLQAVRAGGYEPAPALWTAVTMKRAWLAGKVDTATLQRQAAYVWQLFEATWQNMKPDAEGHFAVPIGRPLAQAIAIVARPDATFKAMIWDSIFAFISLQPIAKRSGSDVVRWVNGEVEQLLTEAFDPSVKGGTPHNAA